MSALKIIRWKFVIPTGLITAGIIIFFVVFFDPLLEKGFEFVGGKINGAKVDIDDLETKLFKGRLSMGRVQIADRDDEWKNTAEFGPVVYEMDPSELMTKRFIINEARMDGWKFNTKRETSGKIPKILKKEDEEPGIVAKFASKYEDRLKMNWDGIKLDAGKKVEFDKDDLAITKQSKAIEDKTKNLPDDWKNRVDNLNVENRLKKVETDIKEIEKTPLEGSEAITAIPESLKKLKQVKEDLNKIKSDIKTTQTQMKTEVSQLKQDISGLKNAKNQDIQDLLGRFNLDFADPKRLANGMIGPAVLDRMKTGLHWMQVVRKHMPSKKDKERLPPKPRAEGMNIPFPTPAAPPKFWLKNATLSGIVGDVTGDGKMTNLTSDPPKVGKPFVAKANGKKGPHEFLLSAEIDHTTDIKKDSFKFEAKNIQATKLMTSGLLGKSLTGGNGSSTIFIKAVGENEISGALNLTLGSLTFDRAVVYEEASVKETGKYEDKLKKSLMDNLVSAMESMPAMSIDGVLSGTWADPDFKLSTNMSDVFGKVIKESVGNVLQEQKKELEAKLDTVLKENQDKLNQKVASLQGKLDESLEKYQKEVDEKINKATGLNLTPKGGKDSPIPGVKIPSLDKLFKK